MRRVEGVRKSSWIGHIVEPVPSYTLLVLIPVLVSALVVLIGYLAAAHEGFGHSFVHTSQVWLLAAETAWVLFWGGWSTRALAQLPGDIRPALGAVDDKEYDAQSRDWLNRVFSPWVCIAGGLVLDTLLAAWFFAGSRWAGYFGGGWSGGGHHSLKAALALILFAPAGPLIVTMLWGFTFYFRFVFDALRHDLVPVLDAAAMELRPLSRFGLLTGLGWSVAVALGIWFFDRRFSDLNVGVMCVFGAMGLTLIVVPQVLAHNALVRTRDRLLVATAAGLPGVEPAAWVAAHVEHDGAARRRLEFLRELRDFPVWIYSPTEVVVLMAEIAIPVAALVLAH